MPTNGDGKERNRSYKVETLWRLMKTIKRGGWTNGCFVYILPNARKTDRRTETAGKVTFNADCLDTTGLIAYTPYYDNEDGKLERRLARLLGFMSGNNFSFRAILLPQRVSKPHLTHFRLQCLGDYMCSVRTFFIYFCTQHARKLVMVWSHGLLSIVGRGLDGVSLSAGHSHKARL